VSAPVLIDAATGTYTVTYTPTGQARLDAYESAGDDFDSFKVDVSDGHYPAVEVTVSHVPISPAEAAVTGTIPVGSTPVAVAFSRDGTRAYVAALFGDTVSVIDTATNTVVTTVPVGNVPGPVAVSPDGALVYVGNIVTPPSTGGVSVIATATNTKIEISELSRNPPALADEETQRAIERSAKAYGLSTQRQPSGAGHDAQMMAQLSPMGMIFVPSVGGISHSPKELTTWQDCANGANVLLGAMFSADVI